MLFKILEIGVNQLRSRSELTQTFSGKLECSRIGVQAKQAAVETACLKDCLRVTAQTERTVDVLTTGFRGQILHDLIQHDRYVNRRVGHRRLLLERCSASS